MRARLSSIALVTALLYIAAVVVLLAAISFGLTSPHSVGALGAVVAAATALAGLVLGFRLARETPLAGLASEEERAPAAAPENEPEPRIVPLEPESAPATAAPDTSAALLFQEQLDAIPIGFAALDRDLYIRAVNPALETLLRAGGRALVGQALRETALGAAVYSGPRAGLAGLRLSDVAEKVLASDEPLDLSRLLVPGNGDGWAARLTARLHGWPRSPGKPECLFVWVQEEPAAATANGGSGEIEPSGGEVEPTLGGGDRARIAQMPDPALDASHVVRLHDALARLQLISAIARWLHEEMAGADAGASADTQRSDLRRRAELQMIEIQAKRIAASLQTLADDAVAARPQISLDSESGPAV